MLREIRLNWVQKTKPKHATKTKNAYNWTENNSFRLDFLKSKVDFSVESPFKIVTNRPADNVIYRKDAYCSGKSLIEISRIILISEEKISYLTERSWQLTR